MTDDAPDGAATGDAPDDPGGRGRPLVPRLDTEGNEPEVQEVFERFREERGNVPNMFRVMGRKPAHLTTLIDHFGTVMRGGEVSRRLKEMISVRVSALNDCDY